MDEQHQESWLFRHFWKWCNVTDVTLANFGKSERLQHVTSPWHTLAFQDWVVTGRWAKTNESGSRPDRQPNVPLFIQSWWFFLGQHRVAWKSSWFVLLWLNADAQSALCSFDVFLFSDSRAGTCFLLLPYVHRSFAFGVLRLLSWTVMLCVQNVLKCILLIQSFFQFYSMPAFYFFKMAKINTTPAHTCTHFYANSTSCHCSFFKSFLFASIYGYRIQIQT